MAKPIRPEDITAAKEALRRGLLEIHDIYREQRAPKELKGFHRWSGDEIYGYAYSPDLFQISDATGRPIRYYVVLGNGAIVHPDELCSASVDRSGKVRVRVRESITVRPEGGHAVMLGSFGNALYDAGRHYRDQDPTQNVTLKTKDGPAITKTRAEWQQIYGQLGYPYGSPLWPTFREWLGVDDSVGEIEPPKKPEYSSVKTKRGGKQLTFLNPPSHLPLIAFAVLILFGLAEQDRQ